MNITVTLIGQIIAFVLLIWFVNKVLWGPVTKMLTDRQQRIAEGLSAAEKGKRDLEQAEDRVKELMHEAKVHAAEIIAQAERRSAEMVDEAKRNARVEAERIMTASKTELEQEVNRAREQLRARVAEIAVSGAQRILAREINPQAHEDLIKDLVTQI